METSTKVLLAGLVATVGLSLYAKRQNDSYNPFTLLGHTGPALPSKTPSPPTAPVSSASSVPGSPQSMPALPPAALPSTQSTPPEVSAALNTLRSVPINSPEAQTALTTLSGFPNSPEAQAALRLFQNTPGAPIPSDAIAPVASSSSTTPDGHGLGVVDDVIRNGDVVDVDMFRSGMTNIPQGVPAVGLIFMNVDSLESGAPDKFLASFVSPEFRIFGQQMVNRSAIVKKA